MPWLDAVDLLGALVVSEMLNVHPERLLLEYLLDAVGLGVDARNYSGVSGFVTASRDDGTVEVQGVELTDTLGRHGPTRRGRRGRQRGRSVDGRSARPARRSSTVGASGRSVKPSKGVHLLTTESTQPTVRGVTSAVLARSRSGRHVVVSPWQGREMIGPTDTPVVLPPDEVMADGSDVAELLDTVNSCRVPDAQLGIDDIDDVTVGIRPLVSGPDADTYSASRRHDLYDHGIDGVHGLWSVTGGKWTTGRAIAEDAVDRVFGPPAGGGRFSGSPTRVRPIPGAASWAGDPAEVFALGATYRSDVAVDPQVREHLARLYGTRCTTVIDLVASDAELGRRIAERPGRLDIAAQVVVAVRDELALTLADIVDRRLVLGTLGQVEPAELQRVARIAAPLLGWPDGGRQVADTEHARRQRRRAAWRSAPAR